MIRQYKDKPGFSIYKRGKKEVIDFSREFGKWVAYHRNPKYSEKFQNKLDDLVEKGIIERVKFINVKELIRQRKNLLPRKESFLCVYCWKKDKSRIKKLLEKIDLKPKEWKSSLQTVIDWLPGGKLYEEAKKNLLKRGFKKRRRELINVKYWNYLKRKKLKNYLPKEDYQKLRREVLEILAEDRRKTSSKIAP